MKSLHREAQIYETEIVEQTAKKDTVMKKLKSVEAIEWLRNPNTWRNEQT